MMIITAVRRYCDISCLFVGWFIRSLIFSGPNISKTAGETDSVTAEHLTACALTTSCYISDKPGQRGKANFDHDNVRRQWPQCVNFCCLQCVTVFNINLVGICEHNIRIILYTVYRSYRILCNSLILQ